HVSGDPGRPSPVPGGPTSVPLHPLGRRLHTVGPRLLGTFGQIGLVCFGVGLLQFGVLPQPLLHPAHQARTLQSADGRGRTRAGQIVQGRERSTVFQPGGGTHHVRQATRTAVSCRTHPSRCPAELMFDGGNVAFGHGSVGVPRDGLICASHDRSSIVRRPTPPHHRRN